MPFSNNVHQGLCQVLISVQFKIVFGLSKPCQDILINHHQGGPPCPAPSEWVEVKKPGMEEPVGEMEERGKWVGATKPVFREGGVQLVVWPSDALTRSLTLVVDKWMECDQNPLK